MVSHDVLVVGAGPTGLAFASELRRHGVSCRLIDQLDTPPVIAKATGIMPRTLEVMEDMGCLGRALGEGVHARHMETLLADGTRAMDLTFADIGTPYALVLCLEQSRTETVLREHLQGLGGAVERPVRIASLRQHEAAVEVTLEHPRPGATRCCLRDVPPP